MICIRKGMGNGSKKAILDVNGGTAHTFGDAAGAVHCLTAHFNNDSIAQGRALGHHAQNFHIKSLYGVSGNHRFANTAQTRPYFFRKEQFYSQSLGCSAEHKEKHGNSQP
jgi:hypothetical protein